MILHINARFYAQSVTGVQRYGRELLAAIDKRVDTKGIPAPLTGITLHIPARDRDRVPGLKGLEIKAYGRHRGHIWEQLELPTRLSAGVLFCPGNTAPFRALLGLTPVIVTIHDLSFRYYPTAYSSLFRFWYSLLTPVIARRAARIITVSESERAAISGLYPEVAHRLVAIQNGGAPAASQRPAGRPPVQDPYILYVGSLSRRKNIQGVLEAFDRLAERYERLHLVVVGARWSAFARDRTMDVIAAQSRVHQLGQVDDTPTLEGIYRNARCLVFPSFYEASPLPPIEAMAYGCPVVAADIPSLRERCGGAALYCNPRDTSSIASAVEQVLNDASIANRLRREGLDRARSFTWDVCAERTLDVISAVAAASSDIGRN